MLVKTILRFHLTPVRMGKVTKELATDACEVTGHRETSRAVEGIGNQRRDPRKAKNKSTI